MKTIIYKLFTIFMIITLISCDREVGDTDYLDGRTPYIGFTKKTDNFYIKEGITNTYSLVVKITEPSSQSINFDLVVSPSSEAVEGVDFTLEGSNYNFAMGAYFATVKITGYYDTASIEGKSLILDLVGNSSDVDIKTYDRIQINLIKFCPIEADFTGNYEVTMLSGGIEAAAYYPVFGDGRTVTLTVGANDTERLFNVKFYPDFGFSNSSVPVSISLVCGDVICNGNTSASGVGCGGSIAIGPSDFPANYLPSDDSSFHMIFTEDIDSNCGDPALTEYLFTKL